MDYQIALAPDLGLSARAFSEAWNDTPECRAAAQARLAGPTAEQYNPDLIAGAVAVLGSVAVGLATNALYDLIKAALLKRGVRKRTEMIQLDQPDGTRLIVVQIVEE
jgi:hypothetical protein